MDTQAGGLMDISKRPWAPLAVDYGIYSPLMAGSIDGTDDRPHDRAVERAMMSSYRCNKQIKGDPKATLFVAHLSPNTKEDSLRELFSKYGKIKTCRLVKDIVTGRSKGYAFIEYKHREDADEAYYRAHHVMLDDARLLVDREVERILPGWIPRRFGGGFGGRKESGQLRFGGRERPFRKPIILGSHPPGGRPRERHGNEWRRDSRDRWSRDTESSSRYRTRSRSPKRH